MLERLRGWARRLKAQVLVVYFAARDPLMPRRARWLALLVAAYALSPIDLIPDVIPVIGLLDDLVLLPLGVAAVIRMTPPQVLARARRQAASVVERPVSRAMAAAIVFAWAATLALAIAWLARARGRA